MPRRWPARWARRPSSTTSTGSARTSGRLGDAFARAGIAARQRFALKANREPEVLAALRGAGRARAKPGSVGIDACSPGEVLHALAHGWRAASEISFTGTNVSERDLDVVLAHPSTSTSTPSARSSGSVVGRPNCPPAGGSGCGSTRAPAPAIHERLAYSGDRPTKFGIYPDRLDEALAVAGRYGLTVDTVHVHAGSGWLGDDLPAFEARGRGDGGDDPPPHRPTATRSTRSTSAAGSAFRPGRRAADRPRRLRRDDRAPSRPARRRRRQRTRRLHREGHRDPARRGRHGRGARRARRSSGSTSAGTSTARTSSTSTPRRSSSAARPMRRRTRTVTVAGHINEGGDVFAEDYPMPAGRRGRHRRAAQRRRLPPGDGSTHCLRPTGSARFLAPLTPAVDSAVAGGPGRGARQHDPDERSRSRGRGWRTAGTCRAARRSRPRARRPRPGRPARAGRRRRGRAPRRARSSPPTSDRRGAIPSGRSDDVADPGERTDRRPASASRRAACG